jgi:hypothetical protein
MRIAEILAQSGWLLTIVADDGRTGNFDVGPYLEFEAFAALRDHNEFIKVSNGGYFIEWNCGADLSADTIEARWQLIDQSALHNS